MSVENEVANLTTSVDNLTEAVNVKKQTLDNSVTAAETARDTTTGLRDEAATSESAAAQSATDAATSATEAETARDDAVAVVYSGDATLEPAPGSIPVADSDSQITPKWIGSGAYPDIRPSLNLDFANTKSLDPRVDFTRATTATYYDGQTFAKAEENLLLQTESFASNGWRANNATQSNGEIGVDGTATAVKLTATDVENALLIVDPNPSVLEKTYTVSIYVKAGTATVFYFREFIGSFTEGLTFFNVSAGTIGTVDNLHTASISDAGGGWYRCSITLDVIRSAGLQFGLADADGSKAVSVGNDITFWGAQLEQRDTLTAYTPTTNQPITNYIPVLQTASPNEPRFDHDPAADESKGLLIEEQRTNLVPDSTAFSGSGWREGYTTVEQNVAVAPNGLIEAAKITGTGGSSGGNLRYYHYTATIRRNFTVSVYAKKGNYEYIKLHCFAKTKTHAGAVFDLETGAVVSDNNVTSKIEPVGNGWYRCQVTPAISGYNTVWAISITDYGGGSDSDSTLQAPEGSFVFAWGAQTEYNSNGFISSHIPTSGSQVTRAKDNTQITGNNLDSWLRLDEGTFDVNVISKIDTGSSKSGHILGFLNSEGTRRSSGFRIYLSDRTARFNQPNAALFDSSGSGVASAGGVTNTNNNEKNVSVAYSLNDLALTEEVGTLNTDDFGSRAVGEVDTFLIGENIDTAYRNRVGQMHVKRLTYYPKRLPNAVLQTLTEE